MDHCSPARLLRQITRGRLSLSLSMCVSLSLHASLPSLHGIPLLVLTTHQSAPPYPLASFYLSERERERKRERMNRIKILVLMSLIPLVVRGVSLLGGVIPSPDQLMSNSKNDASISVSASQADHRSRLATGFSQRRFGGDNGLFRDEKRFSPTGSNRLHNL
uniref:Uncharacterized protein n=1 Tax=Arundo donax TaxID=35708 RepID=A0A0A8XWG0_ARUDO